MNDDKVIEILTMVRNRPSQIGSRDAEINMAIDTAIEALERQIPKKPEKIKFSGSQYTDKFTGNCPACGREADSRYRVCLNCGQAIDWSEVEE